MNIAEIIKQEKKTAEYIESFIDSLARKIETSPIEGVTPIATTPNCFSVKLSTVRDNRCVLSAEYYSPVSQGQLIRKTLGSCKTATDLQKKIMDMIENKFVVFNKNKLPLNNKTVAILKEETK